MSFVTDLTNSHPPLFEQDGVCPVSGLPVSTSPEWINVRFDDRYYASFYLIGERIIVTKPCGAANKKTMKLFLKKRMEFIAANNLTNKRIVELKDYSGITGADRAARKLFVKHLVDEKKDNLLSGFWGFNVPGFIKMVFTIALNNLYKTTYTIKMVSHYKTAMSQAIMQLKAIGLSPIMTNDTKNSLDTWFYSNENFSFSGRIIDNNIFYSKLKGVLKREYINDVFKIFEDILKEILSDNNKYYTIVDISDFSKMLWDTRKKYLKFIKKYKTTNTPKLIVFVGANAFNKMLIAVTSGFTPFGYKYCDAVEEGLKLISDLDNLSDEQTQKIENDNKTIHLSGDALKLRINEVIKFWAELDFKQEEMDDENSKLQIARKNDPFHPLYDTMTLVRGDMNSLLKRRNEAERHINEQNVFNKLRAGIWKLAGNKELTTDELIRGMIYKAGPVFQTSRAGYSDFANTKKGEGDLIVVSEWCNDGISSTIGTKIPVFLIKQFIGKTFFHLTQKSTLESLPKSIRGVAAPIIKTLTITMNIEYILCFPLYENGELKGVISYDVCKKRSHTPVDTHEIERITKEIIQIVTSQIEQKNSERALQYAYEQMEERIEERTIELRNANRELKEANRTAKNANVAKSQFLANISHEIRTPLNGIIGFSEIIADSNDPVMQKKHASQIVEESNKLLKLINGLLDLSKIEAGKFDLEHVSFSIRNEIEFIISSINVTAKKKNVKLNVSIEEYVPNYLLGDPMRLRQILINLIGNAVKFTHKGSIDILIVILNQTNKNITIKFTIRDSGVGISKEQQKVIFDKFVQADTSTTRKFGGTGLGTAIAKELVELMGGKIGVTSEIGKGSEFWFTANFKISKNMDSLESTKKQSEIQIPKDLLKYKKILLVEDYPTNQEIACTHLENEKCIVTVAENGKIAVDLCKKQKYDLVLMDVQMPVMDGFRATRKIRQLVYYKNIPILGMTANAFKSDIQKCVESGMDFVITKPLQRKLFIAKVASGLMHDKKLSTELNIIDNTIIADNIQTDKNILSPIDIDDYIEQMDGNREIAMKILKGFAKRLDNQIEELEKFIIYSNIDEVKRGAHSIKGAASNLGANDLMLAAKEVETIAKNGNLIGINPLFEKFKQECYRAKEYIELSINSKVLK